MTLEAIIAAVAGVDMLPLARQSPGLVGFDWVTYLRCSAIRVDRMVAQLSPNMRVLDFGSYFGNFSLAARAVGCSVEAVDSYSTDDYRPLAPCVALMRDAGVVVHSDFTAVEGQVYDAILCASVIEHIPHTPRSLLQQLVGMLAPGGLLILDTPNLAYYYKRQDLLAGKSIFLDIKHQFHTAIPFEGHHREYIVDEVVWMLREIGLEVMHTETFNYSVPEASMNTRIMAAMHDSTMREMILAVGRKP
jgi:2-polyprenyl-3-methyl-5-hydroxy-6-metoxy-1,4-benzoquinol methylase